MNLINLFFAILLSTISTLTESSLAKKLSEPCPAVGPSLFGDFRFHNGCRLDVHASHELPEDKMRPRHSTPSNLKMKQPNPIAWLDELSDQLIKSTHYVNHISEYATNTTSPESCGKSCTFMRSSMPQCCHVETRLVYPMFGRSITSGKYVRIVQETDRDGFIQPIVYRHCRSENTMLVRGRCHQSILPRVIYITSETPSGYPYRQDLISVPNNCECLVSLDANGYDAHPETGTQSRASSSVPMNIESSGDSPESGSGQLVENYLAQEDELFLSAD